MIQSAPVWLVNARKYKGVHEVSGPKHNPQIIKWWKEMHAPFKDDETPWCAGFVGGVLEESGIKSSRSAGARSYLHWGLRLSKPVVGCIVVFERGPVNGHVAFVEGRTAGGMLVALGGNQGDQVSVKSFPMSRVLGFFWPASVPLPTGDFPVMDGSASKTEA